MMEKQGKTMTPEVEELCSFLRFPSISTDPQHAEDVRSCADWLGKKLTKIGLEVQLHETPQHPILIAKNKHDPTRKTVLLYGHYDVQPVDPLDLWETPPFEPRLEDGRIWARGATDNKGQLFAHVLGIEKTLQEHGDLPVNLICLFEGEEEIGSPHLKPFLEANQEHLACDVIVVSDTGMVAPGVPTLSYGLRGITCCEVKLTGPEGDLHSGLYGGAVANPATVMARLIASFHDENGRVAIEGFYEDVEELEEWERTMWAEVPGCTEDDLLTVTKAPGLSGEAGYRAIERIWARPTCEVNGLWSGYQGEGSKTVLPAEASLKCSFRLVPKQDPQHIMECIQSHIERHTPDSVRCEVTPGHDGWAYRNDPFSPDGQSAQQALEQTFGRKPVLIREGGSIPIIADFKEVLGAESLMLGLALPDCQIHAPNENFSLENFEKGIELNQRLFKELGQRHSQ